MKIRLFPLISAAVLGVFTAFPERGLASCAENIRILLNYPAVVKKREEVIAELKKDDHLKCVKLEVYGSYASGKARISKWVDPRDPNKTLPYETAKALDKIPVDLPSDIWNLWSKTF